MDARMLAMTGRWVDVGTPERLAQLNEPLGQAGFSDLSHGQHGLGGHGRGFGGCKGAARQSRCCLR